MPLTGQRDMGFRFLLTFTQPRTARTALTTAESAACANGQQPEEVEFELTVLERLAERYGTRKGLWGIEILNEPVLEDMWEAMHVAERYPAVDPEKAKGTKPNTMEFIRQFYLDAYDRIRKYMPEEKYVVFHDAFRLKAWKDFMREEKYKNVVLDTHQYLMVAELQGCDQTVEGYVKYVEELQKDIEEMQQYFPVICGEWSYVQFSGRRTGYKRRTDRLKRSRRTESGSSQ